MKYSSISSNVNGPPQITKIFSKKKTGITYSFRSSLSLYGMQVYLFETSRKSFKFIIIFLSTRIVVNLTKLVIEMVPILFQLDLFIFLFSYQSHPQVCHLQSFNQYPPFSFSSTT